MENSSIIFIGMDTHKESTDVSYADEARENAPQHYGKIPTRKLTVQKSVRNFQSQHTGDRVKTDKRDSLK
ncbi:MAG: transposase [Candidatus Azotimanducaceae bacterium]